MSKSVSIKLVLVPVPHRLSVRLPFLTFDRTRLATAQGFSTEKLKLGLGSVGSGDTKLQRHLCLWSSRFDSSLTCAIVPAISL